MMCVWMLPALTIPTTSYANTGGTGDRTALITVTSNIVWRVGVNDGNPKNVVDGSFLTTGTHGIDFPLGNSADGDYWRGQFGSRQYIDEFKLYCNATVSNGTWLFQGSDDASAWTTLSTFTWNAQTQTVTASGLPAEGFLYYRFVKSGAGTWTNASWSEVEFKIAPGAT